MAVHLPNNWSQRPHQVKLWNYLAQGGKRAVAVWHRRAGKDTTAINWTACAAHLKRGTYWHMLPTAQQGRIVIWDGKNANGERLIDQAFPIETRSKVRNDEMKIELKTGSLWQVVGSDNYDRLVGANPIGVVFSEYSLTDPRAWDFIRPILAENHGWALFIFTSRGKNHAYDIYQMSRNTPGWFSELLSVEDTGILTKAQVDEERRAGMSAQMIQQEFYCSFEATNESSYYGKLMEKAETDGRIGRVPVMASHAVDTWWDLGIGDSTAIWFSQRVGQEVHLVDYYEAHSEGLAHYAHVLQDKGYVYGTHYAPHDIEARELGTGKSRMEVAAQLGIKFVTVPKMSVEDGIEAVRVLLGHCWFDAERCRDGIKALRHYHRVFNDKTLTYAYQPEHDWSSHGADSMRYGALVVQPPKARGLERRLPHRGQTYMSA